MISQLKFLLCKTRGGKLRTFSIRMSPPSIVLKGVGGRDMIYWKRRWWKKN